jgi:hypothetical protein
MPFARTPEEEVERWLRVLRLHGQVGIALQALGVSEVPLPGVEHHPDQHQQPSAGPDRAGGERAGAPGDAVVHAAAAGDAVAPDAVVHDAAAPDAVAQDAVARVTEQAVRIADERRARALSTRDVLLAVMHVYGEHFDRVLQEHGTDRQEVLERLGLAEPVARSS